MGNIIDGKEIATKIKQDLKERVMDLEVKPGLAVVLVGEDPASRIYTGMKERACNEIGFYSEKHDLPKETTEEELLGLVEKLNNSQKIHGILVQLPLPKHIDSNKIIQAISLEKDVDGFHPMNQGLLIQNQQKFAACTPLGCLTLIKSTGINLCGAEAVVIGRSNIVGRPMASLLMNENATVTCCHSRTKDLSLHTKRADVIVAAVGVPGLVKGDMIKPGAVVIDVGTTKVDGKLKGDVDFESAKDVAGFITPVPGGVGPMTIATLMQNTYKAFEASTSEQV